MAAISHALMILGFYELPDKDRPDESIYLSAEKINEHFERLNLTASSGQSWEEVPQVEDNEYTKDLRRR